MNGMLKYVCLLAGIALAAPVGRAATYEVDTTHSHLGFAVKHLLVSTVRANFDRYTATVEYDPANPTEMKASARIETASINTRNQKRDDHLQPGLFRCRAVP
jgi:polyisoprenoid-binding protein YceI